MKSAVYLLMFLLIIPFQGALFNLVSIGGVKPDLSFALLYIIGLLTGPVEASLIGMSAGLLLDVASASFFGLMGFTRGLLALSASLLGRQVLDITSPSNGIFLAAFSLVEGLCLAFFLELCYGSMPFFALLFGHLLPQALYTAVLGVILLRFVGDKKLLSLLVRHRVQKEL